MKRTKISAPAPSLSEAPVLDISRKTEKSVECQEYISDPALRRLELGDVVLIERREVIIDRATESGAHYIPMTGESRMVSLGGKDIEFTNIGKGGTISRTCPPELILARHGAAGLEAFLKAKQNKNQSNIMQLLPGHILTYGAMAQCVFAVSEAHARIARTSDFAVTIINRNQNEFLLVDKPDPGEREARLKKFLAEAGSKASELTSEITAEESAKITSMKTKTVKTKAPKAAKKDDGSKGALGAVFGHSITSTLRTLGKHGFTFGQAFKALKAQKIEPAEATIKIQLGRGKRAAKDETYAELTKDQLAELKKDGGEAEVEAPKAAKKAKSKKAAKETPEAKKAESTAAAA